MSYVKSNTAVIMSSINAVSDTISRTLLRLEHPIRHFHYEGKTVDSRRMNSYLEYMHVTTGGRHYVALLPANEQGAIPDVEPIISSTEATELPDMLGRLGVKLVQGPKKENQQTELGFTL